VSRVTGLGALIGHLSARLAAARNSQFVRSTIGVGGLTGAELALGLITAVLMARELGAAGLGTYSLALAVAALAGLPVEFGLPNLVTREIAHSGTDPDSGVAKGVMIFSVSVILVMSAVVVPLGLVYGERLTSMLVSIDRTILLFAVLLIPVNALCNIVGAALAGKQMVVIGSVPQRLVRPGVFAVALGAVSVAEPGILTPARAMALQLGASAAALTFAALCSLHYFPELWHWRRTRIPWRTWSHAVLKLGIANGIRVAQVQIVLLLTGALTSVENVGLLRIAQRGAGLIWLGSAVLMISSGPRVARLNAEGQHARLQRLLTQVARASSGMAMVGFIFYAFAGHWFLATFFGAEFAAAWSALVILAMTEVLLTAFGPGAMLMNMLRHEGVTVLGLSIALIVSTVIAAVLIPIYGASGAALGTFFGSTAMAVYLWHKARRILDLDSSVMGRF
jgi:O-antigen/teichoic acid export membrane protein